MNNPFQLHIVDSMAATGDFAGWLLDVIEREEVISVVFKSRARKIALSSIDDAWVLDLKTMPLAATIFTNALITQGRLRISMRHSAKDLVELVPQLVHYSGSTTGHVLQQLETSLVGDLHAAAFCINQTITPHSKFMKIEHDAYEISLLLPQFEHAIIGYYRKVGIPMAKLLAESKLFKQDVSWWVTYPDVWVRVLASYTNDPTLLWAFYEGHDVYDTIGAMFGSGREYGHLVLAWAACGMDIKAFKTRFRTNDLPDDLSAWNEQIAKRLPNLVVGVNAAKESYYANRSISNLYGRRLRPGSSPGEAMAHCVFGTAEDIISIAAVAFWTNRPERGILLQDIGGSPASESVRISGSGKVNGTWIQMLKDLSPLANPLEPVTLKPIVTLP